jgi:hypothetical protein
VLSVEFRDGGGASVPMETWKRLLGAPSHGAFFNRFVAGRYKYSRADAP